MRTPAHPRTTPSRRRLLTRAATAAVVVPGLVISGAGTASGTSAKGRPAAQINLITLNMGTGIQVAWEQPTTGSRPVAFEVLEGKTVVARNDTTYATIPSLPMGSTHTYTVRARDAQGRVSALSDPITERVAPPRGMRPCGNPMVTDLRATDITPTGLTLAWTDPYLTDPSYDLGDHRAYTVLRGTTRVTEAYTAHPVRVTGLTPGEKATFTIRTYGACDDVADSESLTVTTPSGPTPTAVAPVSATVMKTTDDGISLTWSTPTATTGTDHWAVYLDGRLAARTADASTKSITLDDLWWGETYNVAVVGVGPAGDESAPARTTANLETCRSSGIAAPRAVKAIAKGPSSVQVTWAQDSEPMSTSIKVDGTTMLVVDTLGSTRVTGLAPGEHTIVVDPQMPVRNAPCGDAPASEPVTVTLPSTPTARPPAPTGLAADLPDFPTSLTTQAVLTWTQPAATGTASTPVSTPVKWVVYDETGRKRASTKRPTIHVTLQAGTTTVFRVVAVDAAGAESAASSSVTVYAQGPLVP